eukprot:4044301-Karenia_brevis.AAC.1
MDSAQSQAATPSSSLPVLMDVREPAVAEPMQVDTDQAGAADAVEEVGADYGDDAQSPVAAAAADAEMRSPLTGVPDQIGGAQMETRTIP